jgi:hypothetical protein
MAKRRKHGDRFPLLVYAPARRRWGNLGLLLFIFSLLLWATAPRVLPTEITTDPILRHLPLVMVLVGGLLMFYGLLTRLSAYVQCFPDHLRIQTPIMPVFVGYRRIVGTRPVQLAKLLDPEKEKAARRNWPARYWTMTAVAVDLKGLPLSERWLRLWLDPYLINRETAGFIFLVEDWLTFSQQLNGFLTAYRARRVR